MIGWIKLNRSIQSHWIYTERRKFSKLEAWIDIIMQANFADNKTIIKGKIYEVKRGQSINSMETWSNRWGWDKSAVRRFIDLLQKDKMIDVKSDNITTHLTVCNYETYQGERNADETQTKRKRNANEFQTTPIEEGKKEEEGEEINNKYGKNSNIVLSESEYQKLCKDYTVQKANQAIDFLSDWGLEKPKQFKEYKNHNLTLRRWVFDAIDKKPKFNHTDPKLESWFNSSMSMIKQDLRTHKEHNDVVRQNKYDSKYLLPE
jgi:hypothetical protein